MLIAFIIHTHNITTTTTTNNNHNHDNNGNDDSNITTWLTPLILGTSPGGSPGEAAWLLAGRRPGRWLGAGRHSRKTYLSELSDLNQSLNCWEEKDKVPVGLSTRLAGADYAPPVNERQPSRIRAQPAVRQQEMLYSP